MAINTQSPGREPRLKTHDLVAQKKSDWSRQGTLELGVPLSCFDFFAVGGFRMFLMM